MYFQRFSGSIGQWWFRGLRSSEPSGDEEEEDTRVLEVRITRGGNADSETFGSCAAESGVRGCESRGGRESGAEG